MVTRRRKREKPVPPAVSSVDSSIRKSYLSRRSSYRAVLYSEEGGLTNFEPGCLYTRRGAERTYSQEIEEELY